MDIAVIGNDDFVTGFALAGVKNVFAAEGNFEAELEKALQMKDIGILVMEERQFLSLNSKMKRTLEKNVKPVIITMSDKGEEASIKDLIKKIIGVDLWK